MIDRKVTKSRKDKDGDITALCNPDATWWSPRLKKDAISDIESGSYRYFVKVGNNEVDIHVVDDPNKGKYLRTGKDATTRNNLDDLPDC